MVKNHNSGAAGGDASSEQLLRTATLVAVAVACSLVLGKFLAWWVTDAVSLLATLIDSVLDVLASSLNLLAVRHALSPADREHRFGHGKAEALAGLGQSAFVAGSAGFLLLESARRLVDPAPLGSIGPGVAITLLSIVATLGLVSYQRYVLSRVDSVAIRADSLHYRTDLMVNLGVLLALWLAKIGWPGFDPLLAMAIASYILYSAFGILRQSLDQLMDKELPQEQRAEVERIALGHRQVHGVHDMRSRRSGIAMFWQLHLELDDDLSLFEAHAIADEVEAAIVAAYPEAEVLIHIDPVSVAPDEPLPTFLQDP
jgi:ferrous-iron efflux pump FieF